MTQIKKWLRWCQNHVTALMVMIKLMGLCGAGDEDIVFAKVYLLPKTSAAFEWHGFKLKPKRCIVVLIGLHQQAGSCNIGSSWERSETICDLQIRNNKSYFPNEICKVLSERIQHKHLIGGHISQRKDTVQTHTLLLFPFMAWEQNGSQCCLAQTTSAFLKARTQVLKARTRNSSQSGRSNQISQESESLEPYLLTFTGWCFSGDSFN